MKRRSLLLLMAAVALVLSDRPADSQPDYPNRPIKLMVGFPAGQGTDILARLLGEKLAPLLGQPVIIENRAGQGGSVAVAALAKSPPDGYTMMLTSNGALVVNPHLFPSVGYDTFADLQPAGLVADIPMVLVASPQAPFDDSAGFLAYAKANPGKLNHASPGTFAFLNMSVLEQAAGIKLHNVPYQGSARASTDLMAGRVDVSIDTVSANRALVEAGKLKLLAVGSRSRLAGFPQTPTFGEAFSPGLVAQAWLGLVFPKDTSPDIIARLSAAMAQVLKDPDLERRFIEVGSYPRLGTAEEFGQLLRSEYERWARIVKSSGAKAPN